MSLPKMIDDFTPLSDAALARLRVIAPIFEQYRQSTPFGGLAVWEHESRAGSLTGKSSAAWGPWQIMPGSASAFGIKPDDRNDPVKSTRAVARTWAPYTDWLMAHAGRALSVPEIVGYIYLGHGEGFSALKMWVGEWKGKPLPKFSTFVERVRDSTWYPTAYHQFRHRTILNNPAGYIAAANRANYFESLRPTMIEAPNA
jgi:hypothetical protein